MTRFLGKKEGAEGKSKTNFTKDSPLKQFLSTFQHYLNGPSEDKNSPGKKWVDSIIKISMVGGFIIILYFYLSISSYYVHSSRTPQTDERENIGMHFLPSEVVDMDLFYRSPPDLEYYDVSYEEQE